MAKVKMPDPRSEAEARVSQPEISCYRKKGTEWCIRLDGFPIVRCLDKNALLETRREQVERLEKHYRELIERTQAAAREGQ